MAGRRRACIPPKPAYKAQDRDVPGRGLNGSAGLPARASLFPEIIPPSRVSAFELSFSSLSHGIIPKKRSKGLAPERLAATERRKTMPLYEHVYLARQDISPQQVEALTGQFKAIVTSLGGTVGKTEYWGVKSLAYRIKKNRKAHFTLLNIDAPPAAIAELERQQGINEDILRILTLRVDELEEGPSAQLRKRDDDDRGGERRGGPRGDRGDRPERRPRREEGRVEGEVE
jgi:small subunit ribosomal protein S6